MELKPETVESMNDRLNLRALDSYHYPTEVIQVLETILEKLDSRCVESVLLHGSASRGELSYHREEDGFVWLSDLEFHVILKDRFCRSFLKQFSEDMARLEKEINSTSPLFHIDFSFKTKTQLRHLPLHFLTFDKKESGVTIYGEDCRQFIPDVTLQCLDYRELNQVIFWRLWAIFLHFPCRLLESPLGKSVEKMFQHILYRQVLDITTWLLPREGYLIPTFQARVEFLERNFSMMDCRHYFDSGFLSFLREALIAKQTSVMKRDMEETFCRVVGYFEQSLYCLFGVNDNGISTAALVATIQGDKTNHFDTIGLKRSIWDGLFICKQNGWTRPYQALRWIARKKFRNATVVMLSYLESVRANMVHEIREAKDLLEFACEFYNQLDPFSPLPKDLPSDFIQRAGILQSYFIQFMEDFIKGVGEKRDYITNVQRYLGNDCFLGLPEKSHD